MAQLFAEKEVKVEQTRVRILDDSSAAFLYLVEKEDGSPYGMREIIDFLRMQGVSTGVDNDIIIAMVEKGVYRREIQVAWEIPSKEGKDGYYDYFFETDTSPKKPKLKEDGSVDYTSMSAVESVPAGTKLALYHPAKKGRPGMNVRGADLPLKMIKDLPPLKGKGIKRDIDNENLYLAAMEGRIDYQPGKINIEPVLVIRGDVNQLLGKVEFYGDVEIMGNVESNTTIKAGKSISVSGNVEGAFLQAGENIVLKRGIQGNNVGKIRCKGNLMADFIEASTVDVGGDVEANAVLNSQITADGIVKLAGKHGVIVGGKVHGTGGIFCSGLGNDVELPTSVHVGCLNKTFEEQKKLMSQEYAYKKDIEKIMSDLENMELLARKSGISPTDAASKRTIMMARKKEVDSKLAEVRKELEELSKFIYEMERSGVRVSGPIYPQVSIRIGQHQLIIEKKTSYTEFHSVGGHVEGEVFATG